MQRASWSLPYTHKSPGVQVDPADGATLVEMAKYDVDAREQSGSVQARKQVVPAC